MLELKFSQKEKKPLTLLCLGAHSDDIEIGCGGTILRLLSETTHAEVHWVVLGSSGKRNKEAMVSGGRFLADAKRKKIIMRNFRDGFFPYIGREIKVFFEKLKRKTSPDIIFTHYRHDLHQDHRVISDLTWNTYREHLIFEYEVPKYDGDLGSPNLFVPLSAAFCDKKIDYILNSFQTQKENQWFGRETFYSLLRLRGIEANAPEKYAEAFYCRKMVL